MFYREVNGTIFNIEKFNLECILHRSVFQCEDWTVSCAKTGAFIGCGNTPKEARQNALDNLNKYTKDHDLKQAIDKFIAEHGVTPRYQEVSND